MFRVCGGVCDAFVFPGILGRNAKSGLNEIKSGNSDFTLEFVRWRRKPRWLPVAKSKLFRVPERKPQPLDEKLELMRLNNNYKLQMRSVRLYLREEVARLREISSVGHFVLTPEEEENEFQRCIKENEVWNANIAAERKIRLEKEAQKRREEIEEKLDLAREREEEHLRKIEEIVRREKELSKTFIKRENLESAIEIALANPIDYNFALDLSGNIYTGRTTTPVGGGNSKNETLKNLFEATN